MRITEDMLAQISGQVLEAMAFALVMPGDPPNIDPNRLMVRATVAFRGPFAGRLSLAMPPETMTELAVNMIADDRVEPADALGELCNIICGNVLPTVAGGQAVFSLDPPIFESAASIGPKPPAASTLTVRLSLADGWAEVGLTIDADGEPAAAGIAARRQA